MTPRKTITTGIYSLAVKALLNCSELHTLGSFVALKTIIRTRRRATCFNAGFLLGLFFDPEDGGDMFYNRTRR
jgi:hypothetical protein